MQKQTIDGVLVSRELLERVLSYAWFPSGDVSVFDLRLIDREQLRALLDAPAVQWLAMEVNGKPWVIKEGPNAEKWRAMGYELFPVEPAAQPQDEEFSAVGWSIDHTAGRPILVHNNCSVIEAEQAYGVLELIRKSSQPQGEPVARVEIGADRDAVMTITDDNWLRSLKDRGVHQIVSLYAEQPAPVAVQPTPAVLQPLPHTVGPRTRVMPLSTNYTPTQALQMALRFTENLDEVIVVGQFQAGEDGRKELYVSPSKMPISMAVWIHRRLGFYIDENA